MRAPLSRGLDPSDLDEADQRAGPFGLERIDQTIKRQHGERFSLLFTQGQRSLTNNQLID